MTLLAASPPAVSGGEVLAGHWDRPAGALGPGFGPNELLPERCGACHVDKLRDWRGSRHSLAMGPGLTGQIHPADNPAFAASCYFCHAPLAEQSEMAEASGEDGLYEKNPLYEPDLQTTGVSCAACHARAGAIHGPVNPDGPAGSGGRHKSVDSGFFGDSEFCAACHQLDSGYELNGKVLTNTYREWTESRFAEGGVTCQTCHMPGRRHLFRGIHDPEMTRSAVTVRAEMLTDGTGGAVRAMLEITNTGAGHYLPTYVTPSIVVRGFLTRPGGAEIAGTAREGVIGRNVALDLSRENFDTRIPPGGTFNFDYSLDHLPEGAEELVFEILVYPDEFYNRFFSALIENGAHPPEKARQLIQALEETEGSSYVLLRETLPLGRFRRIQEGG